MAKDRYGFGTSPDLGFAPTEPQQPTMAEKTKDRVMDLIQQGSGIGQVKQAHEWIIEKYMPHIKKNPDLFKTFITGNINDKTAIMKEYANNVADGAAFASPAWKLIQATADR